MNLLHRLERWGDAHHPKWLDIIRIVLGVFLCYKGVLFLQNMDELTGLMANKFPFSTFALILLGHFIAFAHIAGGFLIAIGLFTRFAAAIQIPILLGAIIFVNIAGFALKSHSELFLSIIVLLLLVYFLIVGNGPWSAKFTEEEKKNSQPAG